MAAEESLVHLLDLFDDLWFQNKNSNQPILCNYSKVDADEQPKLARISTSTADNDDKMMMSTTSQESLMSSNSEGSSADDLLSPNSVLTRSPVKLKTIFSGKQSAEDEEDKSSEKQQENKKIIHTRGRKRKGKGVSTKSLSELEFEELKGFMDLGFVFSERDKNTKLVDIIPGLQRLGKEEEDKQVNKNSSAPAPTTKRPYLSQAWEAMELGRKSELEKLKYLKINAQVVENEMVMKHQLRFWAQTVASVVK